MKQALFAVFSVLVALGAAQPVQKRDITWVTQYASVVETTVVTATVWVPGPSDAATSIMPTEAAPTGADASAAMYTEAASTPSTAAPAAESSSSEMDAPYAPTSAVYSSSAAAYSPPASTPQAPAPAASTNAAPAPVSPTPTPSAAQSSSPAYTAPPTAPGSGGASFTGEATWYSVGQGSCGKTSVDSEHVVAISHEVMDPLNPGNPNNNPMCGKTVNINYNGKSVPATVVDRCAGCLAGHIDMSPSLFADLNNGNTGDGVLHGVSWSLPM